MIISITSGKSGTGKTTVVTNLAVSVDGPVKLLDCDVEAVKILKIPMGLVINRADMGDDKVRGYARTEGISILMEIPFDRQIAESYSRGEMFALAMPEWKDRFRELAENIQTLTGKGAGVK